MNFINFVALTLLFVSTAFAQTYLQDEVNKKYGNLNVKDKLAEAMRLEDAARMMSGNELMLGQRKHNLEHAAVLYAQVARLHPEVEPDLQRVSKELGVRYFSGIDSLTESILQEYISGNRNVKGALEQIYQIYIVKTREVKFNTSIRYRREYVTRNFRYGLGSPFRCTTLAEDIRQLAEISKALGNAARIRLWELHQADTYVAGHNCENDLRYDYAKAYELYAKHGETSYAKEAAEKEGDEHLNYFANGVWGEASGRVIIPPGSSLEWTRFNDWFKKAGLTSAQVNAKLRKAAVQAENSAQLFRQSGTETNYQGALIAAIRLYEHLGNMAKVRRLSLERK